MPAPITPAAAAAPAAAAVPAAAAPAAAAAASPAPSQGAKKPAAKKPAPKRGSPRARVHSAAQQADGLLMGLIAYAIAVNYLRGGWSGVAAWGRAKFFNQPSQSKAPAAGHGIGDLGPSNPTGGPDRATTS